MASTNLLRKALKELEEAKPAYVEADKFYTGSFAEPFQSVVMQRLLGRKEVNYKAVLSAVPVDAVVEKLEIVDIQTNDEVATAEIQDIWKANQMQFVHKTAIRAAEKFGDAYIFVWPEYDEPEGEVEPVVTGVATSYQSPLKVRVFYDGINPARKTHAVKRDKTGRGKQEEAWLYLANGTIEYYRTPENKCGIEDFVYVEDIPNLNGEIPFIHLRNELPYGRPLHEKAYGPQNQITKFIVNEVSGSDFNAFPQRYALAKTKGTSGGDDIDWSGTDETVPDQDENQVSKLVSGPGRIWDLSGFDSVGQFNSADVDQYLKPIDKAVELMAAATGTPVYYFKADNIGGGTPSGEAVRQRDARLNTKAAWHQQHLDAGFEEMLYMAADLLFDTFDDLSISIKWKPIEYVSETEKLELVAKKLELGIPAAVAFAEAGYDEETVQAWLTGRPNEAELLRRATLLNTLGDAMQKMGTAAALGLDMANVGELVNGMVSDIAGLREQQDDEQTD
ncbi:phage portal protein [Streptomyces scabiei]|uniref:phage portal protein n=1 Tax=Streptomyces scabiei TaxID=1930 RepID=UPI0029AA038E|nr:phage portal protein [Streptomyces scabiei]MDX2833493.1 phage portal protein [Streptomyces scabiei]